MLIPHILYVIAVCCAPILSTCMVRVWKHITTNCTVSSYTWNCTQWMSTWSPVDVVSRWTVQRTLHQHMHGTKYCRVQSHATHWSQYGTLVTFPYDANSCTRWTNWRILDAFIFTWWVQTRRIHKHTIIYIPTWHDAIWCRWTKMVMYVNKLMM